MARFLMIAFVLSVVGCGGATSSGSHNSPNVTRCEDESSKMIQEVDPPSCHGLWCYHTDSSAKCFYTERECLRSQEIRGGGFLGTQGSCFERGSDGTPSDPATHHRL